jgi:hypothetical protein
LTALAHAARRAGETAVRHADTPATVATARSAGAGKARLTGTYRRNADRTADKSEATITLDLDSITLA